MSAFTLGGALAQEAEELRGSKRARREALRAVKANVRLLRDGAQNCQKTLARSLAWEFSQARIGRSAGNLERRKKAVVVQQTRLQDSAVRKRDTAAKRLEVIGLLRTLELGRTALQKQLAGQFKQSRLAAKRWLDNFRRQRLAERKQWLKDRKGNRKELQRTLTLCHQERRTRYQQETTVRWSQIIERRQFVRTLKQDFQNNQAQAKGAWRGKSKCKDLVAESGSKLQGPPAVELVTVNTLSEPSVAYGYVEESAVAATEVLALVNNHPEGIRQNVLEEQLGISRSRLGQITRQLIDEGQ
ncbi:MAG: hypothetical protein HY692_08275, partial [Cyanobacteria bacterium NC_groundwater_1444_Ag_S-0.65um_54_12]|nr:hypothetical protein [Cyanobacteria bacterium NC_groundwater_1444_Ag_S-0.65um_54_12]